MTTAATKSQATTTKRNAKQTARSAAGTARSASRDAQSLGRQVVNEVKRVPGAAKAELKAVQEQPTRPLYFAVGVADRTVSTVRELPQRVLQTRTSVRQRVIHVAATAGDLAEKAQRDYTEVAKDGVSVVKAVRRQESTQRAERLAERARKRGSLAVKDAGQAVEAGVEAAKGAVSEIG